jgi:excisionase family DNA binding protein
LRPLLNVAAVAKILNCHETHIRRLVSKKKIPFIKGELGIGVKFNPDRLEAWIEEAEIEPDGNKK